MATTTFVYVGRQVRITVSLRDDGTLEITVEPIALVSVVL